MDKLRACIVANYFANAGMTKAPEVSPPLLPLYAGAVAQHPPPLSFVSQHASKSDPAVLNHPAIRRFLESPSRSSSPLNQGSETPSLGQSESESLSQQGDEVEKDGASREDVGRQEGRPGRNTGRVG